MERALPVLEPDGIPERREIRVRTAFGGPGARDGFECALRAVSDGRYEVDPGLARAELGRARERFVFTLTYRDRTATLVVRDGFVTEEFLNLARREDRTSAEQEQLVAMKLEMADRVMSAPAAGVYDVAEGA